jgi:hypothetical protein
MSAAMLTQSYLFCKRRTAWPVLARGTPKGILAHLVRMGIQPRLNVFK